LNHRQFCERFLTALGKADWPTMHAMLDPDFEVVEAAGLPYAGTYRGAEGWKQMSDAVLATWSKFRLGPPEILGETEDTVVVRFDMKGCSRRTGTPFETSVLELWRFRGDKLVRIEPHYFDTHLLAMADAGTASNEQGNGR
jgi:ketosteroid isomerase-like protein